MDLVDLLNPPHGGSLRELLLPRCDAAGWKQAARDVPSWTLSPRQLCDLELLMDGGFSPLAGFMTKADYESVVSGMRLTSGLLWPIPVTLDVTERFADSLRSERNIALRDVEGALLAILQIEDLWQPERIREAESICRTADSNHPGVNRFLRETNNVYIGGKVLGIDLPSHYDFGNLRHSPRELREIFQQRGWQRVIALHTRNPLHRAHVELTLRASRSVHAQILLHPTVGTTKPDDIDHATRMRCYQHVLRRMPAQTVLLSALPLAMRMAGPREALWHAIIRKNFGCTHLIVGRDHAGAGKDRAGNPFYPPYAAQELVAQHQDELAIHMLPFQELFYVEELKDYLPQGKLFAGMKALDVSGSELRSRLREGREIPEWLAYSEVAEELRKRFPPKRERGFTVFFTGLSGAGKSTIAKALLAKLLERSERSVTLLDGDVVRCHLSSELGFSREHRDLNILRIGFVASEITKYRGIAICAPIAPYALTRAKVREMIAEHGGFFEVYVATPLEICEARDRKGLYAKARAGLIKEFTGVSDPYEEPQRPELSIDTSTCSPADAAQTVIARLEADGYLARVGAQPKSREKMASGSLSETRREPYSALQGLNP
jgi:sulfate adenylyltransferase